MVKQGLEAGCIGLTKAQTTCCYWVLAYAAEKNLWVCIEMNLKLSILLDIPQPS